MTTDSLMRWPDFYRRQFEDDAPNLFSIDDNRIRTMLVSYTGTLVEDNDIQDLTALDHILKKYKACQSVIYLFVQQDSWSRFYCSKEMFEGVFSAHNVFLPFLNCFQSFGRRSSEDTQIWDGCYYEAAPCSELCFALRYYERNGRDTGNPWSLRQMALYQKYEIGEDRWVCFLVQPSQGLLSQLQKDLGKGTSNEHTSLQDSLAQTEPISDPTHMISLYVALSLTGFSAYIDSIHSDIVQLNYKASFSAIGRSTKHDFTVTFQDLQKLHLHKQKLHKAAAVLDASRSVCQKLQTCAWEKLKPLYNELDNSKTLIDIHTRRITMSVKLADETTSLLTTLLSTRHTALLLATNASMHEELDLLKRIAFISGEENQKLAKLSAHALKDSRTLKALTTVATLYLPASLVATIFSSSLVQVQIKGQELRTGIVVAKEFWMYILVTGLLTVLTGGILMLLKKPWRSTSGEVRP